MITTTERRLLSFKPTGRIGRISEQIKIDSATTNNDKQAQTDPQILQVISEITQQVIPQVQGEDNKKYWREQLEALEGGDVNVREVIDKINVYTRELPPKLKEYDELLGNMVSDRLLTSEAARTARNQIVEGVINAKSTGNRHSKVNTLEKIIHAWEKTREVNGKIKKLSVELQKLSSWQLPVNSEFPLFDNESAEKSAFQAFLEKMALAFDCNLDTMTPQQLLESGEKVRADFQKKIDEEQRRFQKVVAVREKVTKAFKTMGYLESLSVYKYGRDELLKLGLGKGPSAQYAKLWAQFRISDSNIPIAQEQGLQKVQAERERLQEGDPRFAVNEYKILLQELISVPTDLQTGEIRDEIKLVSFLLKKSVESLPFQKFKTEVKNAREYAEKNLGWKESLEVHENLKTMCEAKGLNERDDEYLLILENIDICLEHTEGNDETDNNSPTFSEATAIVEELILTEAPDLRTALALVGRGMWNQREENEIEARSTLSEGEFYGFHAEDWGEDLKFSSGIDNLYEAEVDLTDDEVVLPSQYAEFDDAEKEAALETVVKANTQEITLDKTELVDRGSTRELAIQAQKDVEEEAITRFTLAKNGNSLGTAAARIRIVQMTRNEISASAMGQGIDRPLLDRILENRAQEIVEIETRTKRGTHELLHEVQVAA